MKVKSFEVHRKDYKAQTEYKIKITLQTEE